MARPLPLPDPLEKGSDSFAVVAQSRHGLDSPCVNRDLKTQPPRLVAMDDVADLVAQDKSAFVLGFEAQTRGQRERAEERVDFGQPRNIGVLQRRAMTQRREQTKRLEHPAIVAAADGHLNPGS